MSNLPNAWSINKVVDKKDEKKKEYREDRTIARIYEAKRKFAEERRRAKFQEWLNTYTEKDITVYEIINNLCREVFKTINDSGNTISNEKILRDEIASFIYKECCNHA